MDDSSHSGRPVVFVTGGSGFIGSRVVRCLLDGGYSVRCLVRPGSANRRLAGLAIEPVPGDLGDLDALKRGAQGCSSVVHLAGFSRWSDLASPRMREVVVDGTKRLLAALGRRRDVRLVFVSSAVTVGASPVGLPRSEADPFNLNPARFPYAAAKLEAEAACLEAAHQGLPAVIVNPAEVYGPDDTALITAGNLAQFLRGNPVLVCRGGTSILHVDDAAAAIVAALKNGRPGERYLLGGENVSLARMAELTLQLAEKKARILQVPDGLIRIALGGGGVLARRFGYDPVLLQHARLFWFMDTGKARRELGASFRPARETLAPVVAWLRSLSGGAGKPRRFLHRERA